MPSGHDAKAAAIVSKLHLERGRQSRPWPVPSPQRRLSLELPFVMRWRLTKGSSSFHSRNCQTPLASPAKPGGLPRLR